MKIYEIEVTRTTRAVYGVRSTSAKEARSIAIEVDELGGFRPRQIRPPRVEARNITKRVS